ncbi:Potassium transporter 7 [Hibiscus syriacus]|uniref:Potassium transporter 7 n=1 Tax=Hibiscus syriacus TaxID=106335 RepID=A0A6A3AIV0_HIBSY|nr:Potassium transporter 7 [Hibiscus syriacus]
MDSLESRWVFPGVEEYEIEDEEDNTDLLYGAGVDSEDEDSLVQCLIRTEPRIDSFDVEALEVHGAYRSDYEDFGIGRIIIHAFQTLGVVFGDVGTSPLYTFSVMFSKAPINGDEDVIGGLSLVLYTLLVIPLVKYVLTFFGLIMTVKVVLLHLYSLVSRHVKVSLLLNLVPSDTQIFGFMLKVLSPELERSLKIKERLETSLTLNKLLLMLVLAGTSMVIADGVVTSVMSVMSSVGGLKLELVQLNKLPFSRLCAVCIGIYNLVKHDASVLRAFNPVHVYLYFKRNSAMRLEAVLNVQQQLDNNNVGIRSTISRLSQLLMEHDEELWRHLEITNKVNPHFYTFRGITLLLTHEFNFTDSLHMWDTLLSDLEGPLEHYGKGERSTPLLRHHASLPRERVPAPKDENDQVDGENNTTSMTQYGSKSASASMTQYGSEIQVAKALEAWIWYMATV